MEDRLNDNNEKTHDDRHLDGRERHLAMAADVVAHQIARARQQLKERVAQRSRVYAPKYGYVVLDGIPTHAPHFSPLATDGTEVALKPPSVIKSTSRPSSSLRSSYMPLSVKILKCCDLSGRIRISTSESSRCSPRENEPNIQTFKTG